MFQGYNINNVRIYLTNNFVVMSDKNGGEMVCKGKFLTGNENLNKYKDESHMVVYMPKNNLCGYDVYERNKKSLFELNIKSILKADIDNFEYEKLFKTYLYHLKEKFEIAMINKQSSYTCTNDLMVLDYIKYYPGLLLNNSLRNRASIYIELFLKMNSLFNKIRTEKIIYYLMYKENNADIRFKNDKEFYEFICKNIEDILQETKENPIISVGKYRNLPELDRLLRKDKGDYSEDEENSINSLEEVSDFMKLDMLYDKKYISELKLSDANIEKINKFIANMKKAAKDIANKWYNY